MKSMNPRWLRVFLFYLIALALSALARIYWHTDEPTAPASGPWGLYRHLISGLGPLVGALVVWTVFRPERRMSLGGTFPALAWAMIAVPGAVLAATGVANPFGIEPHLFGLHVGIWVAAYALLEETGWRGYLQDEFHDRRPLVRYAIVGLFWYAWHLSWLGGHSIGSELANLGTILLASIGIGFVADRTRSILAAAAFHVVGDMLGLMREFRTLLPSSHDRLVAVAICVVLWLAMLRIWAVRDKSRGSERPAH